MDRVPGASVRCLRDGQTEPPFATLKFLALSPYTSERQAFVDQFRAIRLPQPRWAERLIKLAEDTAGGIEDLSFGPLDKLAREGNPEPLAELIRCVDPRQIDEIFGQSPLIWAWLNRTVTGEATYAGFKKIYQPGPNLPAHFERLALYLTEQYKIDVPFLDICARDLYERSFIVNARKTWGVYENAKRILSEQGKTAFRTLKFPSREIPPEPVLTLRRAYEAHRKISSLSNKDIQLFERLLDLLPNHSPETVSLPDLEALHTRHKNPRFLHSVVSLLPPEIIAHYFGEVTKDLLIWTAVNFSSSASVSHHAISDRTRLDKRYEQISKYLSANYGMDEQYLHQAQLTAWKLSDGSVDVGLVMKNYQLFERMQHFDYSSIPVQEILARYRIKGSYQNPERYGVSPLQVAYTGVEGADITWIERDEPWSWEQQQRDNPSWYKRLIKERPHLDQSYNLRAFGQTVRCDSPRGLALTYNGYPIAIASFHIGNGEQPYEFTLSAIQGVRIELRRGKKFEKFPTPGYLGPRHIEILSELTFPLAKELGLPWVHQGGAHSNWRDKIDARTFDNRLHDVVIRGTRLAIDTHGNWRLPNEWEAG